MPEREKCFCMGLATERLEAAARNSAGDKGEQKDDRDSSGHVARKDSLWLRDRKVGFQISGEDRSRFPGRGTLGEVRRKRQRQNKGVSTQI